MGRASVAGIALIASLLLHVSAVLLLRNLPSQAHEARADELIPFSIESVQTDVAGEAGATASTTAAPKMVAGGPASPSNLDRDAREGKSGDGAAADQAVQLFAFDSNVTLQDTDLNNVARNQAQRIETARQRATQEERRATPNASDAAFLASGDVGHQERRKPAHVDSATGAASGGVPMVAGVRPKGDDGLEPPLPASSRDEAGSAAERRAAEGILDARGRTAKASARVALARPNVDRGPAATTAEELDERVRDDVDAELLAARLERSLIEASVADGDRLAPGHGGRDTNADGSARANHGAGSSALPYTPGPGHDGALDTRDGRYVRWFIEQKARVERGLVFPFERAIRKDQGTTIYRVFVTRTGSLTGPPALVRSSGYADFDAAAWSAIRDAVPFAPLPSELIRDDDALPVLIPIAFANPMVE